MGIKDRITFILRSELNNLLDHLGRHPRPARKTAVKEEEELDPESGDFEAQWEAFQREEEERQRRERQYDREAPKTQTRTIDQAYRNLEIPSGSDLDTVKRAWKRLMMRYHPDKVGTDPKAHAEATRVAQIVTESYQILKRHLEKPGKK